MWESYFAVCVNLTTIVTNSDAQAGYDCNKSKLISTWTTTEKTIVESIV